MVSKYKIKIILGYTGLLFIIIIAILGLLSVLLSYQIREEIDSNLKEKMKRIDSWLGEEKHPPPCNREFFRSIIADRRVSLYDMLNITERADDKYLLFIRCNDETMFLSRKYENLEEDLSGLKVGKYKIETVVLGDTWFSITAIHNTGYSIYIAYELSTIKALQGKIMRIFLISFPILIIASILFVFLFTQRLMRTVRTVTETTAGITSRSLNERIPIPSGKDEITNLIMTINAMIDRLEKSFVMIRQFSQDAAHELRTPLTIIRGEIESVMTQGKITKSIFASMESILEEIHYLSSIVNKLLLLHSLDTDEKKYNFVPLNLKEIISDLVEDARILSAKKDIEINMELLGDLKINGDEELISQMIWNILDNAVKYTDPEGMIGIRTEKSDSKILIVVKDTGIGIPQDSISKIFTRFYRVEQSHSREVTGSGLGLAISKWIAVLHNGDILVNSKLNEGSEFTIVLPVYE